MILVKNIWLSVRNLQDISYIIREYYNRDLADELDKLIPEHSDQEYYELECKLDDKDNKILVLEYEDERLENELEELKNK
jgi:hypothetical protein